MIDDKNVIEKSISFLWNLDNAENPDVPYMRVISMTKVQIH